MTLSSWIEKRRKACHEEVEEVEGVQGEGERDEEGEEWREEWHEEEEEEEGQPLSGAATWNSSEVVYEERQ